jgi:hypothetical protein
MTPKTIIQIEQRQVASLKPYARSLRKNAHAVDRMAEAIEAFGFKIPILIRGNGEVVDGELRLKAAKKLGMEEVPVILCDEWSEAEVKAFRLLVNRSASWATFDLELVALEVKDLKGLDFDLNLTGFDGVELDGFLFGEKAEQDKVAPERPKEPVTRPGDLWLLPGSVVAASVTQGVVATAPTSPTAASAMLNHRVLCDDATSPEAVGRLLAGATPVLMVTDPPWGSDYNPGWREEAGLGRLRQIGAVPNDHRMDWTEAWVLFPGDVAYVWHAGLHGPEVGAGLRSAGLCIRSQIIWVKQHFAISRGEVHWRHEPAYYCVREGKSSNWCGDRTQSTVWEVPNLNPFGGSEEVATGHGTQKPLELMRRPILNNSTRGDIVYDPFLGSGTTVEAAELTERICYGLEIDPGYVDVIILRWQNLTGKQAVHEASGQTFDQVAAERRGEEV